MRIAMIGAGYVGLVSAACFSEFGSEVFCVEADPARLDSLRAGDIPFYEPGLRTLVERNTQAGRLHFTRNLAEADDAEIYFLAVGTPRQAGGEGVDLRALETATRQVAEVLRPGRPALLVTKSTVPVGTARKLDSILAAQRPDLEWRQEIDVASNPEFLREGSAIEDFLRPDRVVLGVESEFAWRLLWELYQPLSLREVPILRTNRETAELVKYATNGFLATKITFINEVADLCEKLGANVVDVARGLGMDRRIGARFLHPGPGYGGSCLPKDTRALAEMGRIHDAPIRIVETTIEENERRSAGIANRVTRLMGGCVQNRRIAVLGLTFKPNTDDLRESVSRVVIPELVRRGAEVCAYDPVANASASRLPEFTGVEFAKSPTDAMDSAHALLLLTEWNEFRGIRPATLHSRMAEPRVIDMRNALNRQAMLAAGIRYHGVGIA